MRAPNRQRERGQSLTELAISFVVLVLVLAVGVDLGRAYFAIISLREAAEEGAIFGSFNLCNAAGTAINPEIEGRARSSITPLDLTDVSVSHPSGTCDGLPLASCAGGQLTVTVTHQFRLTMPFVGAIIGTQTLPLSASSSSTILRPATC